MAGHLMGDGVFVEFDARDGRTLAGLRYDPPGGVPPVAALLYAHGKGGNFYSGTGRFIPTIRRNDPVIHLSMNMRCHDLAYTREDLPEAEFDDGGIRADGGMWEDLSIGWQDIDGAVRYLRSLADVPIFVVGHSSGGFYVADYAARRPADTAGRVLLSPLMSNKRPLMSWFGTSDAVARAINHAEELVAEGRGHQLIAVPSWFYGISACSLAQRAQEEEGVWEAWMRASDTPTLCVVGGRESRREEWRALIHSLPASRKEFVVVDDVGHYYGGAEAVVANAVVDFALQNAVAPGAHPGM